MTLEYVTLFFDFHNKYINLFYYIATSTYVLIFIKRTSFAKNQTLNFRGGSAVHDGRDKARKDAYDHAPPPPAWKTASGEIPPAWLAFDKKVVLSFIKIKYS